MNEIAEARPASTVVLLRDTPKGIETLLLRRNKALQFAGGLWVFPGGALDQADLEQAGGDLNRAVRLAAAREAMEESGLEVQPNTMVELSHWTTPVVEPKRFSTWFFAAPVIGDRDVAIDGSEIHDARWVLLDEAVAAHEAGELDMLPPTIFTIRNLLGYSGTGELMRAKRQQTPAQIFPLFVRGEEGMMVLFRGDAGYDSGDASEPGPRHRAVMRGKSWHYIYTDVDKRFQPLIALPS
jgi:8-oxo-dGTP pyrophosphatase MutT (NUDIX family)